MSFQSVIKNNWPGLCWSVLAIVGSLTPGKDMPEINVLNFDKVVHFSFYGIFYIAVRWGLQRNHEYSFPIIQWIAVLYTSLFGLLMECCQGFFISDRNFDIYDAISNILGVIFVAFLFHTINKLKFLFTKN